jgi:uncharacterized protein YchJ
MQETKEQKVVIQHNIPQCVLKNFANDKDQVFEELVMEKSSYVTHVSNSMAERFTYEHSLIELNTLEKFFSRIESYIGPAFRSIISAIEKYDGSFNDFMLIKSLIDRYMREYLIFYYRSGALLHEFSHEQKTSEDRVLLMMRKLVNSDYIRRLSETVINYYSFCLLKSNDGNFILSDQFISTAALEVKNQFMNVSNGQIGMKQVMMLVPISKNYYAVYYNGKSPMYFRENKISDLNETQLNEVNKLIVNNSYMKAVAYNKESLESAIAEFEFQSPVTVIATFKSGATSGSVKKKEIFFYKDDEKIMLSFESADWLKYKSMERNSICGCGSQKKFKNCHMNEFIKCNRMMDFIKNNGDSRIYYVSGNSTVELPIDEWYRYVTPEKAKTNQKISKP